MHQSLYTELAALETTYWWFVAKRRIILSLLARFAEPRARGGSRPRACDIGCGCGALLADLRADGYDAVGIDASPHSRAACAAADLRALDGSLPDGLPPEVTPRPDGRGGYDAVILSDVLEHIDDDRASLAAAARLLRPGGLLVCTVPAHPALWTRRDELHHHRRRYTREAFSALFDRVPGAPLLPLVQSYYNSALFPALAGARLAKRLLRFDRPEPDIRPLPAPLNSALRALFESERYILPALPLPFGASLISVHRRLPA